MFDNPITIAFDVRPGSSGPARYVASLVRSLTGPEWQVEFLDTKETPCEPVASEMARVKPDERAFWRELGGSLVPKSVRALLGVRREVRRLSKVIERQPCAIFHTQNTGCEESPIAARLGSAGKVLGTFHVDSSYDLNKVRGGLHYRAMEWYSNRCLHQAIAVSEATKCDWMRRTGMPGHRIVTVYNGIDPDVFKRHASQESARSALGLPLDAIVIGAVGRLDPAKGFDKLIDALGELKPRHPKALVAIAGSGSSRQLLESKVRQLGLSSSVRFLGFQADVNPVFDACDIFAMPSRCETLGYALLEAMAHELPVVGTRVGGIPEVIVPGECGYLAGQATGLGIAQAIEPLLNSPELRSRMGKCGRQRVIKHFHEREMVSKTLELYRSMAMVDR